MTALTSPYFALLPDKRAVIEHLEDLGLRSIRDVWLFEYSSCTPALCVERTLSSGGHERVVIRGEQQNDLSVTTQEERSIEKEIYMLRTIRQLGLNAAEVLFDGQVFAVPGNDERGHRAGDFRFFLMEYIEGVAIDRRIHASSDSERLDLIEQVAAIYAQIHSIKGNEYGLVNSLGKPVNGHANLYDFLADLLLTKADLAARLLSPQLALSVRRFCETVVSKVVADAEQAGFAPQPSLVLYDGFCGNMLVDGHNIRLIDMALAGYFEPVTEFCAFIFPLKGLLLERTRDQRYWDHFIQSYVDHGGYFPPEVLTIGLLHVMFTNILLHNAVYCQESRGADKRAKSSQLAAMAAEVMGSEPKTIADIVALT